jgi:hypothetical protein
MEKIITFNVSNLQKQSFYQKIHLLYTPILANV